jgi:hypothetical protein
MLTAPRLAQIEAVARDGIRAVLQERDGEVGHLSGSAADIMRRARSGR